MWALLLSAWPLTLNLQTQGALNSKARTQRKPITISPGQLWLRAFLQKRKKKTLTMSMFILSDARRARQSRWLVSWLLPALVRFPPTQPPAAGARPQRPQRAVVLRSGVRVRQRLVRALDLQEGRCGPGRAGGVGVKALGHGAVRGLDLHLRRGAAYPQRLVQAPRRRECRRRGQGHRSRHEMRPPLIAGSREEGRCCELCLSGLWNDDLASASLGDGFGRGGIGFISGRAEPTCDCDVAGEDECARRGTRH